MFNNPRSRIVGDGLIAGVGTRWSDNCWFNAKFGIVIGENTLIGPYTILQSANHVIRNLDECQNTYPSDQRIHGEPIHIGSDVWIGAGCIVLYGAVIPDKCVIGAGTIITRSNCKLIKAGDIVVNKAEIRILGNRKDR